MAGWIVIGTLAAFGIFSIIWVIAALLLTDSGGGVMVCRGSPGFPEWLFVGRWLFLNETGLVRCPMIVVDLGLEEQDRQRLSRLGGRVEICTLEELSSRLELERDQFERTGNGNHPGRYQRCGVSELR